MDVKMLINAVDAEEYRVAIIKDGLLDGYYIETSKAEQTIGNIYKGVVEKVQPALQACFVNYGVEKHGFLPADEIHPEYYRGGAQKAKGGGRPSIERMVKKGQELLVQVVREMPGRKGAHLTTYISIASRYLVLMPGGGRGISRKIEDEKERVRLKEVMTQLEVPEEIGYIVRTAAMKQSKRELSKDLKRLMRLWENIKKGVSEAAPLSLIHKEQDLCLRTLRDYFTPEITEVVVDDKETLGKVKGYMKIMFPRYLRRVKHHRAKKPLFAQYGIEDQIQDLYSNRIQLKSGGSLVIDTTEALISIDVNSGRSRSEKGPEATAFRTNLEAAQEIARQLRLRDLGGLVVIDFIDMRSREHVREIERVMREKAKEDRAKMDLSHISKFGLMELSRERLRPSVESRTYQTCQVCNGRGLVPSVESAAVGFLRQIWMAVAGQGVTQVKAVLPLEVANYLQNHKRKELVRLETRYGVEIHLVGDSTLPPGGGKVEVLSEGAEAFAES